MRSAIFAIAIGLLAVTSPAAAKGAEPFRVQDGHPIGRSSVLNGPNGVNVGPDGKVYVASVLGDEITVHDPQTGAILDRIGPERGGSRPRRCRGRTRRDDLLDRAVRRQRGFAAA